MDGQGGEVTLQELTEGDVEQVVAVAADGAAPRDVMPPDDEDVDEAVWTTTRRRGYDAFLRSRLRALPDGRREKSYVVVVDGGVVGVARLLPGTASVGDVETGLWLVRSVRGRGVANEVLGQLISIARGDGSSRLVADTTVHNEAAVRVLLRGGARLTRPPDRADDVEAALDL